MNSCGNNRWCCEPDVDRGICDCQTGKGTFQVRDGVAQTIIGVEGLHRTATDVIPTPSATFDRSSHTSDFASTSSDTQRSSSAVESLSNVVMSSSMTPVTATVTHYPSGQSASASSGGPRSSATNPAELSHGLPHRTTVIVAVVATVGFVVLLTIALLLVYCCWFKGRGPRPRKGGTYQDRADYTGSDFSTSGPDVANVAQPATAPQPDPYTQAFPSQRVLSTGGVPENRSRQNMAIIPDHDPQRNEYPDLQNPPAFSPYRVSETPPNAFENQRRHWLNRPPSYETQAPSSSLRNPVRRNFRQNPS
ncbi:MAG: hypothetical protein Q9167_007186 [Letrouitia subvulpina]